VSFDRESGVTWELVGIFLEAAEFTQTCFTNHWIHGNLNILKEKELLDEFLRSFSSDQYYAFDRV
jgi:hypothetical protein